MDTKFAHLRKSDGNLLARNLSEQLCHGVSAPDGPSLAAATLVTLVCTAILFFNIIHLIALGSKHYSRHIRPQTGYLVMCLSVNDLSIGLLTFPTAAASALFRCWPFGVTFCQIQAMLRGLLYRQNVTILTCMAADRYAYFVHPNAHARFFDNNKTYASVICISLIALLATFGYAVLGGETPGYEYNWAAGSCSVFYRRASYRILAACAWFFPPSVLFMYFFGSAYQRKINLSRCSRCHGEWSCETDDNCNTLRSMLSLCLSYIATSTPSLIYEVLAACADSKTHWLLIFSVEWFAISPSWCNPLLYWMNNPNHRLVCSQLFKPKRNELPVLSENCCCEKCWSKSPANESEKCPTPPPPPRPRVLPPRSSTVELYI